MFDFEEMRTRIYPWIKAAVQDGGAGDGNKKEYAADMPMKQFLADLLIFFGRHGQPFRDAAETPSA